MQLNLAEACSITTAVFYLRSTTLTREISHETTEHRIRPDQSTGPYFQVLQHVRGQQKDQQTISAVGDEVALTVQDPPASSWGERKANLVSEVARLGPPGG